MLSFWYCAEGRTNVSVQMNPYESFFVVFRTAIDDAKPVVNSLRIDDLEVDATNYLMQKSNNLLPDFKSEMGTTKCN